MRACRRGQEDRQPRSAESLSCPFPLAFAISSHRRAVKRTLRSKLGRLSRRGLPTIACQVKRIKRRGGEGLTTRGRLPTSRQGPSPARSASWAKRIFAKLTPRPSGPSPWPAYADGIVMPGKVLTIFQNSSFCQSVSWPSLFALSITVSNIATCSVVKERGLVWRFCSRNQLNRD